MIVSNDTIMKPPYSITPTILSLISAVSEKIGAINTLHIHSPKAELRKTNRIKTIQSSLEIEGNTLSIEQVTDILENKRIIAPKKDIQEVKNAIAVYNILDKLEATSLPSFLKAHALLMKDLSTSAGKIRTIGVAIIKGTQLTHVAPPAKMVKPLLNELFVYLKKDKAPLLLKSCVFHYELEFIHPFADGNGRMGRLWQTVLLKQHNPVFAYLPVESIIKKKQAAYYLALSNSDKNGNSTVFVEFMLAVLNEAMEELLLIQQPTLLGNDRISLFKSHIGSIVFSRQDYLQHFKNISPPTASRDLKGAVDKKILKKEGDKRTTLYHF